MCGGCTVATAFSRDPSTRFRCSIELHPAIHYYHAKPSAVSGPFAICGLPFFPREGLQLGSRHQGWCRGGRAFGKPASPKRSGPTYGEVRCATKIYLSAPASFRNLRRCERERRLDCRTKEIRIALRPAQPNERSARDVNVPEGGEDMALKLLSMSQKSSLPQAASSVSQVLKRNTVVLNFEGSNATLLQHRRRM